MKKIILITILIVLVLIVFLNRNYPPKIAKIKIGENYYNVEIARTDSEKMQGLAGHKPLKNNEGMLFEIGKNGSSSFWMKGMSFPIDIVWIKNNKVIYIIENAPIPKLGQEDSLLSVYQPPKENKEVDYVLEIKTGEVQRKKIKLGDSFKFL